MSRKDQKVYQSCLDVINGKLSIKEFSILLEKSCRQSQRIVQKVKKKGMSGVKHGNSGKLPHNKTTLILESDIRNLLKKDYYDFNLTHFRERIGQMRYIK